jgi:uncharacterized protein (UPF0335 family)
MTETMGNNAAGRLKSFIERCERLDAERGELLEDRREVLKEAKADGYETKIINAIIRKRRKSPDELAEEQALMDTYEAAIGQP